MLTASQLTAFTSGLYDLLKQAHHSATLLGGPCFLDASMHQRKTSSVTGGTTQSATAAQRDEPEDVAAGITADS